MTNLTVCYPFIRAGHIHMYNMHTSVATTTTVVVEGVVRGDFFGYHLQLSEFDFYS